MIFKAALGGIGPTVTPVEALLLLRVADELKEVKLLAESHHTLLKAIQQESLMESTWAMPIPITQHVKLVTQWVANS